MSLHHVASIVRGFQNSGALDESPNILITRNTGRAIARDHNVIQNHILSNCGGSWKCGQLSGTRPPFMRGKTGPIDLRG